MKYNLDFLKDRYNERIYYYLEAMDEADSSVITVLSDMQVQRGISEPQALNNARACYCSVLLKQEICREIIMQADAAEAEGKDYTCVMQEKFEKLSPTNRSYALKSIAYALSCEMESERPVEKVEGQFVRDLFFDASEILKLSDAEIKEKINMLLDDFSLSPDYIEYAMGELKLNKCCKDAATLREQDTAIKCFLAMELYLENKEKSLEEAVNVAFLASEYKGLHDDASKGLIKKEKMKKILKWLIIGLIVVLIAMVVLYFAAELFAVSETATAVATSVEGITVATPEVFKSIAGNTMRAGIPVTADFLKQPLEQTVGRKIFDLIASALFASGISEIAKKHEDIADTFSKAYGRKVVIESAAKNEKGTVDDALEALKCEIANREEILNNAVVEEQEKQAYGEYTNAEKKEREQEIENEYC